MGEWKVQSLVTEYEQELEPLRESKEEEKTLQPPLESIRQKVVKEKDPSPLIRP